MGSLCKLINQFDELIDEHKAKLNKEVSITSGAKKKQRQTSKVKKVKK